MKKYSVFFVTILSISLLILSECGDEGNGGETSNDGPWIGDWV